LVILRNSYDRNTKNKNHHRIIASPIPAEDLIPTEPNSGSEDISGILDECIRNLRQAIEEVNAALTRREILNFRLLEQIECEVPDTFGGQARGDNFVTSDFDFIIVSDDFLGVPFVKRAAKLYKLWHSSRDLEILCYTLEEWHRWKKQKMHSSKRPAGEETFALMKQNTMTAAQGI
jgi:hypothetical protein